AIVDQREKEVLELVSQIKNLKPAERDAKLAPFVAESEKLGFALLTDDQIAKLNRLRLATTGMAAVTEPDVAEQLKLTDQQKEEISKQVGEYKKSLASLNDIQK